MKQDVQEMPDIQEISTKGQKILEGLPQDIKEKHFGQFIAIEIESGDYFIGNTGIEATQKAQAEYPEKIFFLGRIGYRTAYTFKGRQ